MSYYLNLNKNYNIDLYKYTKIHIGYRTGNSGYIDFIIPEDFINNSNVVYGYDYDGRFFVSGMSTFHAQINFFARWFTSRLVFIV